jgi:hypothetical protein
MNLGAETMHQTLNTARGSLSHTYSETFQAVIDIVKILMCTVFLIVIGRYLTAFRPTLRMLNFSPFIMFLICLLFAYVLMLLITESYFDRYHIPAITIVIILLSYAGKHLKSTWTIALFPALFIWYISIAGTRDYFALNRERWKAYEWLHHEQKIPTAKINAGFEINAWDDGKRSWWQDILTLRGFDYLIQFRSEPGFTTYREFPFKRTFPFKSDTLRIYKREVIRDTIR